MDSTFSTGNVGIGLGSLSNTAGQILRADNFDAAGSGGATAPGITSHPASVKVAVGQPASFTVSASGTPPLTIQWQRDNVDIPGATGVTVVAPRLQMLRLVDELMQPDTPQFGMQMSVRPGGLWKPGDPQ